MRLACDHIGGNTMLKWALIFLVISLIAGFLWSGAGAWKGFGPSAPFFFGAILAAIAIVLMLFWKPGSVETDAVEGANAAN